MKALSIRQPWAHAILHLGKRVENRDWTGCAYRGAVLLHVSSKVVLRPSAREPESFGDGVNKIIEILKPEPGKEGDLVSKFAVVGRDRRGMARWEPAPTLPLGGIVGRARIVGEVKSERDLARSGAAWWDGGFALMLDDVEPLPFIPWRGSLGFFDVPDEVIAGALRRETGERFYEWAGWLKDRDDRERYEAFLRAQPPARLCVCGGGFNAQGYCYFVGSGSIHHHQEANPC